MEGGYFIIVLVLVVLIGGGVVGYVVRKYLEKLMISSAESRAEKIINEAKENAQSVRKEALLESRDELQRDRAEFEKEVRIRRSDIQRLESRLIQKEENLGKKVEFLEVKDRELKKVEIKLQEKEKDIAKIKKEQIQQLEDISGLSTEEAKRMLMINLENEVRYEANKLIKKIETEAKEEAERKAKDIICQAIQRCASDYVAETTVSVVSIPSDEMKGRIIGREGRNIRTLEALTGVDFIIDDTPEAVVLSGYDPVRREIARIALERLIADGRIHPSRIEEIVANVQKDVESVMKAEGQRVIFELGIQGLPGEIVSLLGRLKYRTSYGQNVLQHSEEVAHLAAVMAAELGVDIQMVKRAGLLHDLGKSVDSETEGSHASIGAEISRRFGESNQIIHAIAAHHGEEEPKTIIAVLIQAADALSAARPGARKEGLDAFIKRLEKLEAIAMSFKGVEKAYAIQAGRDLRVIVCSEEIEDVELSLLARDIATKIEIELDYPGQIKVTVIRETRAVGMAK